VVAPDREQRVGVAGVFDAADHQPGGDPVERSRRLGI
jgi:hypothetical protein